MSVPARREQIHVTHSGRVVPNRQRPGYLPPHPQQLQQQQQQTQQQPFSHAQFAQDTWQHNTAGYASSIRSPSFTRTDPSP